MFAKDAVLQLANDMIDHASPVKNENLVNFSLSKERAESYESNATSTHLT